ncbi:MAG: ATP synthase F1 subunit epsilon [Ignavibacteriales bacterium]|nr:ATP synthase F1 subunit epsilon [Ignavibacteriales bacterium]
MQLLELKILTPEKTIYNDKIKSLSVPGTKGSFQVLLNHAPIISSFEIGIISVLDKENIKYKFVTSGGIIKVENNKLIILAETVETPQEIDLKRAEEALHIAKKKLSVLNREDIDFDRAEIALKKAINRIRNSRKPI